MPVQPRLGRWNTNTSALLCDVDALAKMSRPEIAIEGPTPPLRAPRGTTSVALGMAVPDQPAAGFVNTYSVRSGVLVPLAGSGRATIVFAVMATESNPPTSGCATVSFALSVTVRDQPPGGFVNTCSTLPLGSRLGHSAVVQTDGPAAPATTVSPEMATMLPK